VGGRDLTALNFCVQAYREIEDQIVSESVFSQYIYKMLPNSSQLWIFKKHFCMQMALSGAPLSHPASQSPRCFLKSPTSASLQLLASKHAAGNPDADSSCV